MYTISHEKFGAHTVINLASATEKFSFCLTGGTPLSYKIKKNGDVFFDIFDGFRTPEEFDSGNGSRNWIMTPFANRIAEDSYTFNGKNYKLHPIPPKTRVIHGFTAMEKFEIIDSLVSEAYAKVTLKNSSIRKEKFVGYPFDVDVFISFELSQNKLSIVVTGENLSDVPIPFWSGWHPYFKTDEEGIENLQLKLNATKIILMDESFIPLPDEQAYGEISNYPDFDLRGNPHIGESRVNGKIFDLCYADIVSDEDGFYSTKIIDETNNLQLRVYQNKGVTLLFSGDSLADRKRKSIAVEPMQCLTNSFNRKDFYDEITILPGKKSSFLFGVEVL
ncbi:MAG: aldose 1-epimerase [Ignavibacteriaceae bacterium]|nr:aldose 1-epimerase [Ignavibacteriaceae bacterium]